MTGRKTQKHAETGGTEITRFNALRHGVLSRHTVLPWEDADEYHALVAALVAEHAPQGPTEEHSKGMWRQTYERLRKQAHSAERRADEVMALQTERLVARIDKHKSKGSFWR